MARPNSHDVAKVVRDLLAVFKVAMPGHLYAIDARVRAAESLLESLRGSFYSPPSVPREPAMPFIGPADVTDPLATELPAKLDAMPAPHWDITQGLDEFMASELAPASRSEAVTLILREWLTANGYLELPSEEAH